MSTGASIVLVIVGLALCIVLSTKFKVNGGVLALFAAWIIGSGLNGMKASALVSYWPVSVMFILISTSLFFGVARANGTLNVLTMTFLYKARNVSWAFPFAIFAINFIIGAAGAGSIAPQLFMATLIYGIAKELTINVLILQVASWAGATAGGGMFWSAEGANRIAYYTGIVSDNAVYQSVVTYSAVLFVALLFLTILWYFILGGWKGKGSMKIEKPEPFNAEQKKTLVVVAACIGLILVFAIAKLFFPNATTIYLANMFDVQFVCIMGFVVCLVLKLCDDKKIIDMIPLNLILTIGGFCVLIKVAIEFNLPEIFADILLNFGLPGWALPSMFLIFSACISLFANFAVIYPLLMPLIPVVAAATGMNSITLFCGMCLGSCLTGFSPFSTGGACQLSGCTDTDLARKLTPRMLLMAFFNAVLIAAILASGILNFLPDPLA